MKKRAVVLVPFAEFAKALGLDGAEVRAVAVDPFQWDDLVQIVVEAPWCPSTIEGGTLMRFTIAEARGMSAEQSE